VAVLPARSVAVHVADCVPAVAVDGVSQPDEARPDSASAALAATVTVRPANTVDGVAVGPSVGGVESRAMVTDRMLVPPALAAWQVKVTPEVSATTTVASQPVLVAIALCASLTSQPTVTSLVYQPPVPCVPVTTGVISGPVGSVTE
jgi:hypothetical protein